MAEARIDKWMWASRIFKTRTIAAEACLSSVPDRAAAGQCEGYGRFCQPFRHVR